MMRLRIHWAVLAVLVPASAYALPPRPQPPETGETLTTAREVGGVHWPAGATLFFRADTKALVRAHVERLATPWKLGDVSWPAGTHLDLNARGEVTDANRTLAAAETVGGVHWPAGTHLGFEGTGRVTFARRRSVAGETVGGYVFPAGAELELDAQGKLRSARVHCDDEVFASVRWKRGTLVMVSADGALTALRTLAASETIGKVRWPAGTSLFLDSHGEVLRGSFQAGKATKFAGVLWPAHTELQVTADGKVVSARITTLPEPTVIQGKRYDEHMWIKLDPATGKVTKAHDPRENE